MGEIDEITFLPSTRDGKGGRAMIALMNYTSGCAACGVGERWIG